MGRARPAPAERRGVRRGEQRLHLRSGCLVNERLQRHTQCHTGVPNQALLRCPIHEPVAAAGRAHAPPPARRGKQGATSGRRRPARIAATAETRRKAASRKSSPSSAGASLAPPHGAGRPSPLRASATTQPCRSAHARCRGVQSIGRQSKQCRESSTPDPGGFRSGGFLARAGRRTCSIALRSSGGSDGSRRIWRGAGAQLAAPSNKQRESLAPINGSATRRGARRARRRGTQRALLRERKGKARPATVGGAVEGMVGRGGRAHTLSRTYSASAAGESLPLHR